MGWLLLRPTTAIPARAFIQVRALSASSRRRRPAGPLPADYRVVEVDCGSSGSVAISLHNVDRTPPTLPLLIYLPPFPTPIPFPGVLPTFLRPYPTAVIHYRWSPTPSLSGSHGLSTPLHWPAPIHDVSFAYSAIIESCALAPSFPTRRPLLLLSSHLAASLATSLALTESRPHLPYAVRALAVYNGIYNWTMFLPNHRVHRPTTKKASAAADDAPAAPPDHACPSMRELASLIPDLFGRPSALFDPFASPSLFFRTSGLDIPASFTHPHTSPPLSTSRPPNHDDDDEDYDVPAPPPPPRRAALVFPPRTSTLKIPETTLLYTRDPPAPTPASGKKRGRAAKPGGNSFEAQALEMTTLMRRSVEREVRERRAWDHEVDDDVPLQRVRAVDLGEGSGAEGGGAGGEIGPAEAAIKQWLKEKFGY